jgi:hypothetical protein
MMNAATGTMFTDSHHVKGEGHKNMKDFRKFKCVFCLEWVKIMIKDLPYWVRCANMYNFKSPGCTEHPKVQFKDGPNRVYSLLAANKQATWGMIRNTQLENEPRQLTPAEQHAEAHRKLEDLGEQMAVAQLNGEDITGLEIEFQLIQQRLAQLPKTQNTAASQQTGPTKALPAATTDDLRVRGGTARVLNNRQKTKDLAPGNQTLDNKRSVMQNARNNKHKSKAWLNTLKSIVEEEPAQRRRPRVRLAGPALEES